ncbi:hypothetical protein HDK77DRAFT_485697 [Phyllosticta capitalensis]
MSFATQENILSGYNSQPSFSWADEMIEQAESETAGTAPKISNPMPFALPELEENHTGPRVTHGSPSSQHAESNHVKASIDSESPNAEPTMENERGNAVEASQYNEGIGMDGLVGDTMDSQSTFENHCQFHNCQCSLENAHEEHEPIFWQHWQHYTLGYYKPPFPPWHPGWVKQLSPSISNCHATPPEINKWVFTPPIGCSLDLIVHTAVADDYSDLSKPATVKSALRHTDFGTFPEYAFPHGAWGVKRPLRNTLLPRRPDAPQRSRLWRSSTLNYSNEDVSVIEKNVSVQMKALWGSAGGISEHTENWSAFVQNQSVLPFPKTSETGSDDLDDSCSSTDGGEDQSSDGSIDTNECGRTDQPKSKLHLSEEMSHDLDSVSEPDLHAEDLDDFFGIQRHELSYRHRIKKASAQDLIPYLDLATSYTTEWGDIGDEKDRDIPSTVVSEETFATKSRHDSLFNAPKLALPTDLSHVSPVGESECPDGQHTFSSTITIQPIEGDHKVGCAKIDKEEYLLRLAAAKELPGVDFVEDFMTNPGYQRSRLSFLLQAPCSTIEVHIDHPNRQIARSGGPYLRFGAPLVAGGRLGPCKWASPMLP